MKLRKFLLGLAPIIVASSGLTATLTSCNKTTNKLPKISSHRIQKALLNLLSSDDEGNLFYVTSEYGTIEVHHFNDSTIGYINVDDYVNTLMQFEEIYGEETSNYKSTTKDYKTVITNTNNNSTATIDYTQQTITFSDYDMFCCEEKAYAANPLAVGAGGGEAYYWKTTDGSILWNSKYVSGGQYVIDLSKYSILAYSDGENGYLPYDFYRNILNRNPLRSMFYNGVNFYEVSANNNVATIDLYKTVREEATILNAEYMEYCYNLLAITLDNKFGLTERPGRSAQNKGKTIKYFPNGAYERLAPYKEGLTSLDPDIANDAMCQFFQNECDDGGHAGYSGLDILCTRPHVGVRGYEKANTFEARDKVNEARAYAKLTGDNVSPADYWQAYDEEKGTTIYKDYKPDDYIKVYGEEESNPIMYITFDAFNSVSRYTLPEMVAGHVIYDYVDETNYFLDTIRMTMYANKFIREYNSKTEHAGDKQIKNVVLDLTNNGGGTVYTEHFLASWLCGGVTEKVWNPHTKAYAEYTIKANVNGDDTFDANDFIPEGTNIYCMTSEMSFSCGNMLPCNLADADKDTIKFIGCPSGGGACFVDGNMHVGLGNVFRSSSNYHMLKKASTQTNPISVESGNQPTEWFYEIPCTWEDCYKYADRATINTKIRA